MRINKSLLLLFLFLTAFSVALFAEGRKSEKLKESELILTFGTLAHSDPQRFFETTKPFIDYLSKKINADIHLKIYNDYASILNDIDHEGLDIAILSPIVYAMCMDEPDLTFLASVLVRNKPVYHSVLLTRRDSPILSVRQLAGKKIGFVDKYSASGYVYPAAFLRASELVEGDLPLYNPIFLGGHERVVRALMENQIDAAATFDEFFDYSRNQVGDYKNISLDNFRILKLIPDRIPQDALVCKSNLGQKSIIALKAALAAFEAEKSKPGSPIKEVLYSNFKPENRAAYEEVKLFLEGIIGRE